MSRATPTRPRSVRPLALLLSSVLSLVAGVALAPWASALSTGVVISQVYGGGGNSGAPYTHDFVELFNRGSAPVSLNGWSVQYTSATGTGVFGASSTQLTELPNVTLQPGQYYLIQEASTAAVGAALPAPDLVDPTPIPMSATGGKVALASIATSLGCNGSSTACTSEQLASIVDLVGFGTANFYEGSAPAPAPSNTTSILRAVTGCTEIDANNTDFATGTPTPRNTATTFAPCASDDLAPTVVSVVPADGATDVPATTAVTVTFSEPVTAGSGAFALACDGTDRPLTVSGGSTAYTLTPDAQLPASAACTLTVTASAVVDQVGTATPMASDVTSSFTVASGPPVACAAVDTPIGVVQGSGETATTTSPVTVQGVVVGDYEGPSPTLRGFYLQDAGDGDAATSDGIFVFNGSNDSVSVGQVVQVTGTPAEFQGQTQLGSAAIESCGTTDTVTPVDVALPVPAPVGGVDFQERFEGMLVRFPQVLSVSEHFQLGRFGQVVLSSGGRLPQPTSIAAPGPGANAIQDQNNRNRIVLDDSTQAQNPDPIVFGRGGLPLSADNTIRGGDTVTGLTGVLTFTWGGNAASPNAYRVRPIGALGGGIPDFAPANPRPSAAPAPGGRLKVASMNVLNYFLTLDVGTTPACGPIGNKQECRGAETAEELQRQQTKLNAALVKLNADVIAMMELENTQDPAGNDVDPLADIVGRLNASVGAGTYAYVNTGILGTDTIRVGLIFKPAKVTATGAFETLDSVDDPRFDTSRNRPSLAQTFTETATGEKFTIVANHLKSKGSCPTAATDPNIDQGDGQGCWNPVRTQAASALVDWIASDPTGSGDPDVLVVGDLNAYAKEDPVTAILAGSDGSAATGDDYENLILRFGGPNAYSYAFDGQWGYLDHALSTLSLGAQVAGAGDYHINADEPSVLDFNTNFKTPGQVTSLYNPDEFRISDHDPVVVGLDLDAAAPTVTADVTGTVRPGCAADCYDGSATVTLSADEPATISYRFDGGPWQAYDAPIAITGEGRHTVDYYGVDGGGHTSATESVTVLVTQYPVIPVRDAFNRRNGSLGGNWAGAGVGGYRINDNQVLVRAGGMAFWRAASYGPAQAAAVTLSGPIGRDTGVVLKVQPGGTGGLKASYNAVTGRVVIGTYASGTWRVLRSYPADVHPGSVLGGVALADGTVKAYVDCVLIGSVNVPAFAGRSGRAGIFTSNSYGARLDDFRAMTISTPI